MSMEPGKKAPYSVDLRWRVVWKRLSKEISFKDIARSLEISASTAHYEFMENGGVVPQKNKGPSRKLNDYEEMFIIGLVLQTPAYVFERDVLQSYQFVWN